MRIRMPSASPGPKEGRGWIRRSHRFLAPLLPGALPHELSVTAMGQTLRTSEATELHLELFRIPPDRALAMLQEARSVASAELARQGDRVGAPTSELEIEEASAGALGARIAQREQDLWHVGIRFSCFGRNPGAAERLRDVISRRLAALGFRPRIPIYQAALAAEAVDLSGRQPRPPGYWHMLHTDGVAAFYPFVDETVAEPGGILMGLQLDDATPVFLDRWSHSSYSWGLFGTTGAGKSFASALFLLRTLWMRPETKVVILDPLGEFGEFAQELGGSVLTLGAPNAPRLNPLDPATTGGDRSEKAGRVGTMLRALFPSLRDEETATLDSAVTRLYDRGPVVPTLSDLIAEVGEAPRLSERLLGLLEVFRTGSLRHLDGPSTLLPERSPVVVDLEGADEEHLPFHLAYLLDWAYGQLRTQVGPKLLLVDEAHVLVRHAPTALFLDRIIRHVRHFEAGVMIVSQSPEDFLKDDSGRSILRNLRATLLLRLAHARPEVQEFYGLTDAELQWLTRTRLPRETGYAEALLRAGSFHLPLGIVASTPEYDWLQRRLGRERPDRQPAPPDPSNAGPTPRL
ncbi:MAG: DUF87 domain-containing protein [Thermoplasmata archaeon]